MTDTPAGGETTPRRRRQITIEFDARPDLDDDGPDVEELTSALWAQFDGLDVDMRYIRLKPAPDPRKPDLSWESWDGVLTVGQLREITEDLPGHTQVVMDDGEAWYVNVGETITPGPDPEYREFNAVTLMRGRDFDPRQL